MWRGTLRVERGLGMEGTWEDGRQCGVAGSLAVSPRDSPGREAWL